MRVVKYLLIYSLIIAVVVIGGFVVTQRVLLSVGTKQLQQAIKSLRAASDQQVYYSQCRDINRQYGQESSETLFQLRFLSDTEYVIESVCAALPDRPQEITRAELPPMVSKLPGSSGFLLSDETTQVKLGSLVNIASEVVSFVPQAAAFVLPSSTVKLSNQELVEDDEIPATSLGPESACQSYGYVCCNELVERGVGQSVDAQDCHSRCFVSCQPIPTVLAFTAAPNFDQFSRSLTVRSGETVEFWVVADTTAEYTQTIEFGDGDRFSDIAKTQPVVHRYICLSSQCQFTATVQLEDSRGNISVISPVSTIKVNVTSQ